MPVTVISTNLSTIFAAVPKQRVETAVALLGPWTLRENLYVDDVSESAAPSISEAHFTYHYGTIRQPDGTSFQTVVPLDIDGLFIHISLRDWSVTDAGTDLGLWNANTNSPGLATGIGTLGDWYIVSVDGATDLDGTDSWRVGQCVFFDGTHWKKGIEWYGIVEVDRRTPHGSIDGVSSGIQSITAYHLLRILEKATLDSSVVNGYDPGGSLGTWDATANSPLLISGIGADGDMYTVDTAGSTYLDGIISWAVNDKVYFNGSVWTKITELTRIGRGLTFNSDQRGEFMARGNRSATKFAGPDATAPVPESYVFSYRERAQNEWTAETAVKYLLTHFTPEALSSVKWLLSITSGNLNWNPKGSVETDRRSIKSVLDELISRHRGVGYYLSFLPSVTKPTITVTVFSYSDVDIVMADGTTFDQNPNQYSLDFEQAFDISSCTVENKRTTQFHRVIVEGDWRTSTCSLRIDKTSDEFIKDWSSGDEIEYMTAASAEAWYAALTREAKRDANRESRNGDKLNAVFKRFMLSDVWNGKNELFSYVFKAVDVESVVAGGMFVVPNVNEATWNSGLQILDKLPLRERYDYSSDHILDEDWTTTAVITSEPPFLEPFAFIQTNSPRAGAWEMLDRINSSAAADPLKRKWYVNTKPHNDRAAIELDVQSGPQHFLAATDFAAGSPAAYSSDENPAKHLGLNWYQCWVTLTFELSERCRHERVISTPAAGEQERILRIRAHDCRLDYAVPFTVVGIVNGELQQTTGGFVRDDRKKLQNQTEAAALWYGNTRQTLNLAYKQVRTIANIGDLIVDIGSVYTKTDINSVVSSIIYDMSSITTRWETSFAEYDQA